MSTVRSLREVMRKVEKNWNFRFPMSTNEALHLLAANFEVEVNKRGAECVFDQSTVNHLIAVARYATARRPKFGLMLGGDYGRGKTMMMYAFRRSVNYLHNAGKLRELMGQYWEPQFRIYQAVDLVDLAKEDKREFKRICGLNMLGIDDLGVEATKVMDYGSVMEPMMRLLEHRYNRQLFTMVTSNLTPAAIRERFDERIGDRLAEMMHLVVFEPGLSYRRIPQGADKGAADGARSAEI